MSTWTPGETGQTCPRCGRPTHGAWSEGGGRWALCEECLREKFHARDEERGRRLVDEEE
jgi:hypothetical protein